MCDTDDPMPSDLPQKVMDNEEVKAQIEKLKEEAKND